MIKHLKQLIDSTGRELLDMKVQCFVYEREVKNPTNMGLEQAKEFLVIYQKRCKHLEAKIQVYLLFAKANNIKL